jgi:hypothetical protein
VDNAFVIGRNNFHITSMHEVLTEEILNEVLTEEILKSTYDNPKRHIKIIEEPNVEILEALRLAIHSSEN